MIFLLFCFSYGELFFRERARKKKEEEEKLAEREREKVFLLHSFFFYRNLSRNNYNYEEH